MTNHLPKLTFFVPCAILIAMVLSSCSTTTDTENRSSAVKLPVQCKRMAPIKDIWKLEPILLKYGKIKDGMSKVEKENAIRQYILNKTKQYEICLKK